MTGLVGGVAVGNICPGSARPQYPQNAVQDGTSILPGTPPAISMGSRGGNQDIENCPLGIGQVSMMSGCESNEGNRSTSPGAFRARRSASLCLCASFRRLTPFKRSSLCHRCNPRPTKLRVAECVQTQQITIGKMNVQIKLTKCQGDSTTIIEIIYTAPHLRQRIDPARIPQQGPSRSAAALPSVWYVQLPCHR
jgi:hypothetical protein